MEHNNVDIKRVISASIDDVWNAWTDPTAMKEWYSPEGMTVPEVEIDTKPGGSYMVSMAESAEVQHVVRGSFSEVEDKRRLVFSWQWDGSGGEASTVTVEFTRLSDTETEVHLVHSGLEGKESQEQHTQGWESTLNNLEKYLA